jgi:hypothetical protein
MPRQLDRQHERRGEPPVLGQLACGDGVLRRVVAQHRGRAAEVPRARVLEPQPRARDGEECDEKRVQGERPCRAHVASLPAGRAADKARRASRPRDIIRGLRRSLGASILARRAWSLNDGARVAGRTGAEGE